MNFNVRQLMVTKQERRKMEGGNAQIRGRDGVKGQKKEKKIKIDIDKN